MILIMDYLGWIGAVFYIVSYLLLSFQIVTSQQVIYHFLNIVGAVCLILNALQINDLPNVVVNIVWAVIGLLAIYYVKRKSA
ncbi:hypothetical protein GCM10011506_37190 [Marivirga lumbricoides]|uniref:CBU-0592-like domain-containing protein n=1 Tax=Marivirga lumbricoides TaxID=1046115 RepID=A0ABQ1MW46_9BACT|nr:hypothetical protein GCM10011506_37190 [Marivirga lumbricoides]